MKSEEEEEKVDNEDDEDEGARFVLFNFISV